jgi:hypothetical protein
MKRSQFVLGSLTAGTAIPIAIKSPASATADSATLTAAKVRFHVLDHQLDTDSFIRLALFSSWKPDATQYATTDVLQGTGDWVNGKDPGPFDFSLKNQLRAAPEFGYTWLRRFFTSHGNNNFHYDLHLRFDWSDGTSTSLFRNGVQEEQSYQKSNDAPIDINSGWMLLRRDLRAADGWPLRP